MWNLYDKLRHFVTKTWISTHTLCNVHFRYSVVEPPDNRFGGFDANGMWDGMVGQLVRKVSNSHTERDLI